jgi:hypothetical protein
VSAHEVLIPLMPGVQPLDVAGPHEVLMGMRRAFLRRLGVTPDHYRRHFAAAPA